MQKRVHSNLEDQHSLTKLVIMNKKIILFGCQKIAVDCIEYISQNNNVDLISVYTYDLPLDITYGYESVEKKCKELNIEC